MQSANAILLLMASLWASLNAKAAAWENINKRRDIILLGALDGMALSPEHRRMIYERDWKPLAWAASVASGLFGLVVMLIPYLVPAGERGAPIAIVCFGVASFHVLAAVLTGYHLSKEAKVIEENLKIAEA